MFPLSQLSVLYVSDVSDQMPERDVVLWSSTVTGTLKLGSQQQELNFSLNIETQNQMK